MTTQHKDMEYKRILINLVCLTFESNVVATQWEAGNLDLDLWLRASAVTWCCFLTAHSKPTEHF